MKEDDYSIQAGVLETFFRRTSMGLALFDSNLRYSRINDYAASITGHTPEELIGWSLEDNLAHSFGPEAAARVVDRFRHTLETGEAIAVHGWSPGEVEGTERRFCADCEIARIDGRDGPAGILLTVVDVTHHVLGGRDLKDSDHNGCHQLSGLSPASGQVRERTGDLQAAHEEVLALNQELSSANQELTALFQEVSAMNEEISVNNKKLEAALSELDLALGQKEEILERISDGFYALDSEWRFTYINREAERHIERKKEELLNHNIWEVLPDYVGTQVDLEYHGARERKAPVTFEAVSGHTGRIYEVSAYPSESGLSVFSRDVTGRRRFEQEMSRLERMSLVGQMAAGIGHEIRNPMTAVRGFLQLLSGKDEYSGYREYFRLMVDELDRANSIITEYLSLSRNKPVGLIENDLNLILRVLRPLIEASAMNMRKEVIFLPEAVPRLPLNESEVRQLILNLAQNGLDAMTEGGTLTISTHCLENEVVLSVADQGSGIDPEIRGKIGLPFTTTKEKGTGLGLAVCYGIASRHNARIDFTTGSGGTTFYVRFGLGPQVR